MPTQSSTVVPTPDSEIGQYSSQQRPVEVREQQGQATPTKGVVQKATRTSKPAAPLVVGLDDSESESDDDDDGLKAIRKLKAGVDRERDDEKRRLAFEEKQRLLKARKEAAVKAQMDAEQATRPTGTAVATLAKSGKVELGKSAFLKGVSRPRQDLEIDMDSDADDDLEILDTPAAKPATRKPGQRLNPKDMLDVKREQGGKSRNGGGRLQFAPRQDVTESMFQHAGQTFDQAGKRQREGTAAKTETGTRGSNKLAPITTQQSYAYLLEHSRKVAALERQKKEKESGLKSRALQPRREQLIDEAVLEETRKAEERRLTMGAEEEPAPADDDDDSEDGDFAPERAEDDADPDVEMEDRLLVEETQDADPAPKDVEMADDQTPEAEDAETAPIAATPVDSLEETEEAVRQRKRKRQAVLDSDEEEEVIAPRKSPTAKRVEFSSEGVPESSLLSRKVSEPSAVPAPLSFGGGFDDFAGGFGESGGLSQFFGATQAPGATGSATQNNGADKGLDALRQGTPAAGHLAFGNLGAVVSATAQERNLALFGADLAADAHSGYTPKPPQRQYLNSQG